MKNVILGVLACIVILIVGLFACGIIYSRDHYKIGGMLPGGMVIKDMKDFDAMNECVAEAKKFLAATSGVSSTHEAQKDTFYLSASDMTSGGSIIQECLPNRSRFKYVLAVKTGG